MLGIGWFPFILLPPLLLWAVFGPWLWGLRAMNLWPHQRLAALVAAACAALSVAIPLAALAASAVDAALAAALIAVFSLLAYLLQGLGLWLMRRRGRRPGLERRP